MKDTERYELAETLAPLNDEQRAEFVKNMETVPSPDDLVIVSKLISDLQESTAEESTEDAPVEMSDVPAPEAATEAPVEA